MKLLLTSAGNTNKSIESALLELLGKPFAEANLVFIPTAANHYEDNDWVEDDINNFKKLGFKSFNVIDIAQENKQTWQVLFDQADILVFGGGNEKYLLDWIRKIGLDQLLTKYLKTKVYVGISAGSMITATTISLGDSGKLYYEDFNRQEKIDGLGYVDFEIRPHLNSDEFPQVRLDVLEKIATHVDYPIYAIDDDSAVKVVDGQLNIISEGEWQRFS